MTYDLPILVLSGESEVFAGESSERIQAIEPFRLPHSRDAGSIEKVESYAEVDHVFRHRTVTQDHQGLIPYTTTTVWRKLPLAIRINDKLVLRYKAPTVTEYIDQSTGEIIQASDLKSDPRISPHIHFGEIILLRQALINSLRREVREFALFVLRFRNNRRGITPEISTLVEWYARLHNKKPSNVRRYVAVLEKAGFLAGSSLLSRLFQRTGKRTVARDHLGEEAEARRIYFALRFQASLAVNCSSVLDRK